MKKISAVKIGLRIIPVILVLTTFFASAFFGCALQVPLANAAINPAPSNSYKVNISGSTYIALNPSGVKIYSSSSASSVIQTAINKAPAGSTIYISPGVYTLTTKISITKAIKLVGSGQNSTTIQMGSGVNTDIVFVKPSSDCVVSISFIKFDGRRGVGQVSGGHGIQAESGSLYCDHVTVVNTWGSGIVTSLKSQNINTFQVTNSRFDNCGNPSTHVGPAVRADASSSTLSSVRINVVRYENNYVTNCREHGLKVYENVANKAYIKNNYIENIYYQGIFCNSNSEITGNTIINAGMDNSGNAGGIYLSHGGSHVVSGNTIISKQLNDYGVRLSSDIVSAKVENNTIKDCEYGILCSKNYSIIASNKIYNANIYGILVIRGVVGCQLLNNIISGAGDASIKNYGTGTTIRA